jgi:hypothetical protein
MQLESSVVVILPGAHEEHEAEPDEAYCPAGHRVHWVELAWAYIPTGQATQVSF